VATSKSRQRALARAKVERQIARRAATARRRRQLQAGIGGALALILVVVGVVWATGGFDPDPATPDDCAWTPETATAERKDVGTPPTTGIQKNGTQTLTLTTNLGVLSAVLDPAKAPCTVASIKYLAGKGFFDNTVCHRLTTSGIFVLQCGDPSATGRGGPTYKFPDENLPDPIAPSADPSADPSVNPSAPAKARYSRGELVMANSGQNTNGSQFFIVYKDTDLEPKYSRFGTVVSGLDWVDKVATDGLAPGTDGAANTTGEGTPKTEVKITALTVTDVAPPAPSTSASTAPSTSASVPASTPASTPASSASASS
jgi:peptidyl-prolyl cis-trans isomerase B (cyclophilin B)